jgi:hypothetical protein
VNFESFLNFFTRNVESIIQWLFLLILALTGFLISRGLLSRKQGDADSETAVGPSLELENVLKQILERTQKLESLTVQPGLSAEAAALAETQVQSLKKELASREEELKGLKAAGSGAQVSEEAAKLNTRLKELESKLAEYEILEDDIADLSLYKEENSRLRSELNKLKSGEAAAAPAAPAEAPAAPTPGADDIVAEFAEAVSSEPAPDSGIAPAIMEVPDTGNPMKDFEAAVKIEKEMAGAAPAPAPAPAAAPAAPAPAAKADGPKGEADDLFAEFSESPDTGEEAGGLDTDKMMAEMAALVNLEPSSGSSLDDGIDTDKMAAEAGSLNKR